MVLSISLVICKMKVDTDTFFVYINLYIVTVKLKNYGQMIN